MSRTYRKKSDGTISKRDKKSWQKPPKWFKKIQKKIRRAKAKDAKVKNKDYPKEKKTDTWDWN